MFRDRAFLSILLKIEWLMYDIWRYKLVFAMDATKRAHVVIVLAGHGFIERCMKDMGCVVRCYKPSTTTSTLHGSFYKFRSNLIRGDGGEETTIYVVLPRNIKYI